MRRLRSAQRRTEEARRNVFRGWKTALKIKQNIKGGNVT